MTTTPTTTRRTVDSPIGPLTLAGEGSVLTHVCMEGQDHLPPDIERWPVDDGAFPDAVAQLGEYFAGERTTFDLELRLEGTEFQRRVWSALLDIPYGETRSYGELALAIENPSAVRAVGLANGRNPIALVVPCHRVIGADGSLTGYGGGLERKRALLDLERGHRSPRLPL